jgi:hypothetical protein
MNNTLPVPKRKRMGRPRKDPERARSNRVVTFVTEKELAQLECMADFEKTSLSAIVHRILHNFLKES